MLGCGNMRSMVLHWQVSEEGLKRMLEQISEQQASKTKVTVQRRRPQFDDDDRRGIMAAWRQHLLGRAAV